MKFLRYETYHQEHLDCDRGTMARSESPRYRLMYNIADSPFAHLFGTNDVPSDEEATRISQLISKPIEELRGLDEEIARLMSRLDELRLERDKVEAYVDPHRVLLTPVRRLPPDILGEIFVHCLPTDRNPTRSLAEAPLLLGMICRSWRDISLSTPRVWTGIHVYIPHVLISQHQSLSDLVELRTQGVQRWLGRSGTLPLSISLKISRQFPHDSIILLEELARTLIRLSPRWSCLDLRVPYAFLKIIQQSVKPDNLPRLRDFRADLQWTTPPDGDADHPEILCQRFLAAPTLVSVAIVHHLQHARSLLLPVSMASLTSLAIQCMAENVEESLMFTTQEALAILMQCKRLQRLHLPARLVHATAEDVLARVDLPDLIDLKLVIYGDGGDISEYARSGYHAFFARLCTPSLKHLVLIDYVYQWRHHATDVGTSLPFLPLLSGHESRLESLYSTFPASAEALLECLRLVPRLTALNTNLLGTLGQTVDTISAHLQLLIPTAASPIPLCPSLEDVCFTVPGGTYGPSDETIVAFIQSRWCPPHPEVSRLQKCYINLYRPMITNIGSQVRILQEEGMDLFVTPVGHEDSDPADEGASPSRYFVDFLA